MKLAQPVLGIKDQDLSGYPAHWVEESWESFSGEYRDWLDVFGSSNPLYCLPQKAIDCLAREKLDDSPLMASKAIAAEKALASLCHLAPAVGFASGRFIFYPLLGSSIKGDANDTLKLKSSRLWSPAIVQESIRERLKGYAGRLITYPAYLKDVASLKALWNAWPDTRRPILPLARSICTNDYPVLVHTGSSEQNAFETDFQAFCDKWLITGLATWDLPVPKSPVLPGEQCTSHESLLAGMLTLNIPFFFPLVERDSILATIYEEQRKVAEGKGLLPELSAISHYKAYGRLLEAAHIEYVILSRFGPGQPRRKLVGSVEKALGAVLSVSPDQVKKLRKAISASRRGKHASIAWLKPRRR